MAKVKVLICPYCGDTQPASDRCRACNGLFEPFSRQATHNAMGPWFVRDENRPFQPGASYETIVKMVERGQITKYTIVRGPTTKQFWTIARHTPGVAHLLGYCHQCDAVVNPGDLGCDQCGAPFGAYLSRNALGLPEIKSMPWDTETDLESSSQAVFGGMSGMIDSNPLRPQAPGLSSFGTDTEISHSNDSRFSMSSNQDADWGSSLIESETKEENGQSAATSQQQSLSQTSLQTVLDTSDPYDGGARLRSLQRRLAREQRMTRLLAALMVVSILVALASGYGWFRQLVNSQTAMTPPTENHKVTKTLEKPADTSLVKKNELPDSDDKSSDSDQESAEEKIVEETPKPIFEDTSHYAAYQSAQEFITQSADETLSLDDRIALVDKVIEVYSGIESDVEKELWPINFTEEIARLKRLREMLELKKDFPG